MDGPFAIITFRADGPIKSWSDMRGAHVHNSRTKPIEHAVPGSPEPEHLVGTGDLVADVRSALKSARIDPHRLRKNGVIAYEAIMTASPTFFESGSVAARAARLQTWVAAQKAFATKRWGSARVASMVLHLDEKTPHIHLVVVPIEVKADGRRKDRTAAHFGLVGRMISGPGQFDRLQDDYAAAMASLGLVRGRRGSGAKHEPTAKFLARVERRQQAAREAELQALAESERLRADRARVAETEEHLRREKRVLDLQAEGLAAGRASMACERAEIDRARAALDGAREAWMDERDREADAISARQDALVAGERRLKAAADAMTPIFAKARGFLRLIDGIRPDEMAPRVRETVQAIERMRPFPVDLTKSPRPESVLGTSGFAQSMPFRQSGGMAM